MYDVSAQGVDERMIKLNVHYYYYYYITLTETIRTEGCQCAGIGL